MGDERERGTDTETAPNGETPGRPSGQAAEPRPCDPPTLTSHAVFDAALAFVLRAEGGDSDDPDDPGGRTRYGISKAAHPDVDIPTLTLAQAREIYRADYWRRVRGDDLPARLAFVAFDAAVNQGVPVAASLLQQALGVQIDGEIGPRTLAAAARLREAVLPRFLRLRAMRYVQITRANPRTEKFLAGWLQRLFDVHAAAMGMPV